MRRSWRRLLASALAALFSVTFGLGVVLTALPAGGARAAPTPELDVKSEVRHGKVYLEFRCRHFRLAAPDPTAPKRYGEGHIVLTVDGREVARLDRRVFVVEGLKPGAHAFRAELVHRDGSPYGVVREWTVAVP
ncbi:MAG: hypothetical protein KM312_04695 [Hydrogenibacillus schlegelii]|uniref:Uncharacterized protein n=1 Tax=Hydrogenibacillus schlegelii TaxID=1484 RepID=A0A947D0P7_HYDSH|nr:hypothetical protein [Hydrogenibacillus schlegelii]